MTKEELKRRVNAVCENASMTDGSTLNFSEVINTLAEVQAKFIAMSSESATQPETTK